MPDVIVIDESPEVVEFLASRWADSGVRLFHTDDTEVLRDPWCRTSKPAKWAEAPSDIAAIVIDLDLGADHGPLGGLRAADALRNSDVIAPVVLRTQHMRDGRDLAAVLAVELLNRPLPWWDRNRGTEMDLLRYILDTGTDPLVPPTDYGATMIHPVAVRTVTRNGDRVTWPLGRTLLGGQRWSLWSRVDDGSDPEAARYAWDDPAYATLWEAVQKPVSALAHLKQVGTWLHTLAGRPIDTEVTDDLILRREGGRYVARVNHRGMVVAAYFEVLCNAGTHRIMSEVYPVR